MKESSVSSKRSASPVATKLPRLKLHLLTRWLNNSFPGAGLTVQIVPEACKTGVLLASLLEAHGCPLQGIYKKPAAKKSALYNIEQVLSTAVWKRGVAAHLMPTAEEILNGESKVWLLVNLIFESFVVPDIRGSLKEVSSWTNRTLAAYGRRLQVTSINSPYSTLAQDLTSGVVYGCLLHCFSESRLRLDTTQLYASPRRAEEINHNIRLVLQVATTSKLPVCFSVEEFSDADPEFRLMQLVYMHSAFKGKGITGPVSFGPFKETTSLEVSSEQSSLASSHSPRPPLSSMSVASSQDPPSFSDLARQKTLQPNRLLENSKHEDYSLASDEGSRRVKNLELRNANLERRFMYIADLRRKRELELEAKPVSEPASPAPKSVNYEALLCFLMTPREMSIKLDDDWIEVSVSLVPNESQYTLYSEAYFFEWRPQADLDDAEVIDLHKVTSVNKESGVSFLVTESLSSHLLVCRSAEECDLYVTGLNIVLQRAQRKKL
jgi:hypothetical protein